MTALLIRNGIIVNDDAMFKADVLVDEGAIREIGDDIKVPGGDVREIDASGRLVMPGGIDPHTHLQFPFGDVTSVDDFYQGSRAALAGGTTMFIDFVVPNKGERALQAYRKWRNWADNKVCCDYGLSVAITSWSEDVRKEMTFLTHPEYGINSFKFFMAYSDLYMMDDGELYCSFVHCRKIGALARVHAENGRIISEKQKELLRAGITGPEGHRLSRPEELEEEATNRACIVAAQAKCPLYVVHVMSKGAARSVFEHRRQGNVIFGEPLAAGLAVDGSHYYNPDFNQAAKFVMSPPLSCDLTTKGALMDYLACGKLDLVATDNCSFTSEQKAFGRHDFTKIPNGVNGIEDRMSIVWDRGVHSGKMSSMRFVAVTSSTAAKIFNIYPQKGRIAVGSDADIIIWNADATRTISSKSHHHVTDTNIFEGITVHGVCEMTISRGKVVWEDGELRTSQGAGRFVPLPPYSPICYP